MTKSITKQIKHKSGEDKLLPESSCISHTVQWSSPDSILDRRRKLRKKLIKNATTSEIKLKLFLQEKSIKFKFQYIISPYIADFFFPQKGLVLELDGSFHNSSKQQLHDSNRELYFFSIRLITIRFNNNFSFNKILDTISNFPDISEERKNRIYRQICLLNTSTCEKHIKANNPNNCYQIPSLKQQRKLFKAIKHRICTTIYNSNYTFKNLILNEQNKFKTLILTNKNTKKDITISLIGLNNQKLRQIIS